MAKKILVIDDDMMVTRALGNLLSKQEYSATVSQDGYNAVDSIISARDFDLIICDLRLPGINGIETIRKIKEHLKSQNKPDIPVIFITGYAYSDLHIQARNLGKVLTKRFDNTEFLESVKEYITYGQTELKTELPDTTERISPDTSYSILLPLPRTLKDLSPSALSVDVTNKCNLRCRHCFWYTHKSSWSATTNKNILNLAKAALEKYSSITNITWYGGEPLIEDETKEIIEQGLTFRKIS